MQDDMLTYTEQYSIYEITSVLICHSYTTYKWIFTTYLKAINFYVEIIYNIPINT